MGCIFAVYPRLAVVHFSLYLLQSSVNKRKPKVNRHQKCVLNTSTKPTWLELSLDLECCVCQTVSDLIMVGKFRDQAKR